MNFKKTGNSLHDLDIGKITISIEIISLYTNDPNEPTIQRGSANMSDKECCRILGAIDKHELDPGWEFRYFVGKLTGEDEDKTRRLVVKSIKDFIGSYIEFQGKKYFIHKP